MNLSTELMHILFLILVQFKIIFPYWILGVFIGSVISVFLSDKIYSAASSMRYDRYAIATLSFAATLGVASPICMYGTIPLIAALGRKGVPQHFLAAFMVSSILLNPNLFILSFVLGGPIAMLRLFLSIIAGVLSGTLVRLFFKKKSLFNYEGFEDKRCRELKSPAVIIFLKDMHRCIIKTAPYFILGIVLAALFDLYFPKDFLTMLFKNNKGFGVLLSATLGVPIYVCGGGTIPILKSWLDSGMSMGSAAAFMITGPATKFTNLSAVKIILGVRIFVLYLGFNLVFAVSAGMITDLILNFIH